jgi:3'-5' exoribonuclease
MEIPMNKDVFKLTNYSQRFGPEVAEISKVVLENPKFPIWWGGLKGQHHDFKGGLARHTTEVVDLCFNSAKTLNLEKIDKKELFLSALFHDAGKMFDYVRLTDMTYMAAPHKRIIHHISRSALIWSHAVVQHIEFSEKYHDVVLHNILSHHGHREFGSPVAPKTQAAWLVHLCDGISARMNDCDRLDLVHDKPKGAQ